MAIQAADAAPGSGRYYTRHCFPNKMFCCPTEIPVKSKRATPQRGCPMQFFSINGLWLFCGLGTVDNQLCAIPTASVGGAHELHLNDAVGQRVRNFRSIREESFHRAAFQRQLVSLEKRELDTLSGPGGARKGCSRRGRSGCFGRCRTFSGSGFHQRGYGRCFSSRRRLSSGCWLSSGCFFLGVHAVGVGLAGTTTARGRSAATGHDSNHRERQHAQKNLGHLFTLSNFLLRIHTRIPSVSRDPITPDH